MILLLNDRIHIIKGRDARPVDPVADDKTTKPTVSANANANAGTVR